MHERAGGQGIVAPSLVLIRDLHAAQGKHDLGVAAGRGAQAGTSLVPHATRGQSGCVRGHASNLKRAGDETQSHSRRRDLNLDGLGNHAREFGTAGATCAAQDAVIGAWLLLGRDIGLARDGDEVVHGDEKQAWPFDLVRGQALRKFETDVKVGGILGF